MAKTLSIISACFGLVAFAAMPTVSNETAKQRYPWGLVDITCTVSGIDGATAGYKFALEAVMPESGNTNKVSHFWVVQNGTNSTDRSVHANGSYHLLWDARADLGQECSSNMILLVKVVDLHDKVQLWKGGPYWAATNIGADEPHEYGYYFWWGDTVGYKRVNSAWVASDGSSLGSSNTPPIGKDVATLEREGWITSDGVLTPEHDAAHVQWGGDWRMPTQQELDTLNSVCEWTWTTMNGVNGYIVRGKGDYALASIFFPAAGYRDYTSLLVDSGTYGWYWSSVTFSSGYTLSCCLYFCNLHHTTRESNGYFYGSWRNKCKSVRPVQGFTGDSSPMVGVAAPMVIDLQEEQTVIDDIAISWDAAWIGGNSNATVVIADNGTEVRRVTGAGEFTYAPGAVGQHLLTYTTYIGGIAQDEVYSATVYTKWKYEIVNGGAVITETTQTSGAVTIPDEIAGCPVIGIRSGLFSSCNEIVRLTLPSTLTAIGYDELPPKIKESLAYDPDGFMIYQGWLLGYRDKDATSLTVPEGVIGIGSCALAEMYDLETVNLPQTLKYIAEGAFREDTYLDNLVIPDGAEIIGDGAFEDCSFIQTMTLGNGIKSVGARAFAGCTQLSGVMFDEGLVEIGAEAFDGCWRMLSVSLPISVTNVVSTAFRGCTSLTGVTIPTHCGRVSNWFAPIYSQIRDVTLLEDESDICVGMFKGCSSLRSIHLPDSVTNIAAQAFYGCSSLTELRMPESLSMIGSEAFRNCSSLTAAALPGNVTSIGARAFQGCSNLSALTLPRGLESLPDYVFAGCSSFDSFVVPAAVTNLGNYIVSGSTTAIYYLGNAPAYGANVYGNASGSLKSYVILGTKGWDGRPNSRDIPASWNGRDILTWSANQFDVTFDANGGLFFPVVTNTYDCEETTYTGYSLPPFEPVRKGMDFDGYWTEPGGGTRVFTSTRVLLTKPHTLYAHWKKGTTIKVRFNACGGTVSPAEDDYVVERPYCELPVPVREHFAFAGWWTEASGGSRVEISSEVPKAAHELFAHWTPNHYTIRFHACNGTSETRDQEFVYGEPVTLDANAFARDGYAFAGWATTEGGASVYPDRKTLEDVSGMQNDVLHLYATWVSTRYAVRFDANGGVGRMDSQAFVRDVETNLVTCAFTRTGYEFGGWAVSSAGPVVYTDGASVTNVYELTGSDVALYAVWVPIEYSISYDANGGAGLMSAQLMVYDVAAPLAYSTFTKPGSLFRGWATASDGAVAYREQKSVMNLTAVADDVVTLYAVWQEKSASVLACEDAFSGAGTVTLDDDNNIVVTLTNDVSGTVEIPDNVGAVKIDLNGHDMVGDGGPALRIVAGDGEGGATLLAIVDTSEGEKGRIAGGGESAGIEVSEDAAMGVKLDVEDGVGVFNGDGSEQELKPKLVGAGKVTTPKTWKVGQKVTWKAKADKGSVFARWEGPLVDSLDLAKNERRNPSLAFAVPEGFETNQIKAVFIPLDDDGLYALGITQTEFDLKETVSDVWVTDDSQSYVTATASGLPTGLKFNAKTLQITGAPTKGGVYWVQIKAKNASGYQWAENVKVTVSGGGKEAKEPKLTRTAYHPLTVICATEGGTASGTGVYAEGKKVTIKATPAKGYVFAGWYETAAEAKDGGHGAIALTSSMSVVVPEMRYVFAKFVTADEDRESIRLEVSGVEMETAGAGRPPYQTNIWAGMYVEWPVAASALSETKVKVAGLPAGLKFTDKDIMKNGSKTEVEIPANTIYGAPTAASKIGRDGLAAPYQVKITVTTAGKASQTYQVGIVVDALPAWAVGTFNGGLANVTVAANGKISGKLMKDGETWTLSGAAFETICEWRIPYNNGHVGEEEGLWRPGDTGRSFGATVVAKYGKSVATNYVEVSETRFADATSETGYRTRGVATVRPASAPSQDSVPMEWTAWQNLWRTEPWKTMAKAFAKAPALEIEIEDGAGGTVTLKFAASGAVTASGKFVTGKDARGRDVVHSATCSSVLIPDEDGAPAAYRVHIYFPPKAGKFEGHAADIPLVWNGDAFGAR